MKQSMKGRQRPRFVVGIDEVGRGPLAGPVAIGMVAVSVEKMAHIKWVFRGIRDSKQHTLAERELWFKTIKKESENGNISFCVSSGGNKLIDRYGLGRVIRQLVRRGLKRLNIPMKHSQVLLDGGLRAPKKFINQKTIIKGDEKIQIISIASVAAKVIRDRRMVKLSKKFPGYGFEIHKGYGTKRHTDRILKHGLSELHRVSFCKNFTKALRA